MGHETVLGRVFLSDSGCPVEVVYVERHPPTRPRLLDSAKRGGLSSLLVTTHLGVRQ